MSDLPILPLDIYSPSQTLLLPQGVVDAFPFGAYITDTQLNIVQINKWLLDKVNRPAHDILGKTIYNAFSELNRPNIQQAYQMVLQDKTSITLSNRFHKNFIRITLAMPVLGLSEMPQTATLSPIFEQGRLIGTLTTINDVTERLINEENLKHEVKKLNLLHQIDRALSTLELEDCLNIIVEHTHQIFKADIVCLFLKEDQRLVESAIFPKGVAHTVDLELCEKSDCDKKTIASLKSRPVGGKAEIATPLMIQDKVIGVLHISAPKIASYNQDEIALLEAIAIRAASAIRNARLHTAERTQRKLAETLRDIGLMLTARLDPEEVLDSILVYLTRIIPYNSVTLMLFENGQTSIKRRIGFGEYSASDHTPVLEPHIAEFIELQIMAQTRSPLVIPDTSQDPNWAEVVGVEYVRSWAGAPIIVHDELAGFLTVEKDESNFYSPEDGDNLLAFAAHAGLALENARLYAEQQRLAVTDGLTGLTNRRRFDEVLAHEIERAIRFHRQVALVMIDLDNFKRYNDTYGHPVGDILLQNLAALMRRSVRAVDTPARYGGEEFVLVLPETGLEDAYKIAERLRNSAGQLHLQPIVPAANFPNQQVTISLGIAVSPEQAQTPQALLKAADTALYTAKRNGKNQTVKYSDQQDMSHG
jgi:diguanylate cyclase (GGDEF)-like protein